jgi:Putative Ig domain
MITSTIQPTQHQKRSTSAIHSLKHRRKEPEFYTFTIHRMEHFGNGQAPIPEQVTLLRPTPKNPNLDQLFIDQMPIPRDAWNYDPHDRILIWQGAYGGGRLHLYHSGDRATGTIGSGLIPTSVSATITWHFICDVALNTGATYVSSGQSYSGFSWDTTSTQWQNADWKEGAGRLLLTLTQTPQPYGPAKLSIQFTDQMTQANWQPSSSSPSITLGPNNAGQLVWSINFSTYGSIPSDTGSPTPPGPDTVFPNWLQAVSDRLAININGVMQIDDTAPNGTLVGFQGKQSLAAATGYYRTSKAAAPFGVFAGRLTLDGQPIGCSWIADDQLHWQGLSPEQQQRIGLPERGYLKFNPNGSQASAPTHGVKVSRLQTTAALEAIAQYADLHPTLYQQYLSLRQTLSEGALDIGGLLSMTPMAQDNQGNWYDAVQLAVTNDLSTIMNSFVPSAMWNMAFPGQPQPTLTGELAIVANTPVSGVADVAGWYTSLATAVLTEGLANGSDPNCANMNGPRAAAWLQTQLATSAVYNVHSQALFAYEWQQRNNTTQAYLDDQSNSNNADNYNSAIQGFVDAQIADIQANVIPTPDNPTLVQDLIADVQAIGDYATNASLYWALQFYLYNTAPSYLDTLPANLINGGSPAGSPDGTTLTRIFQINVAVLTALDPSGYIAQQYTQTMNVYLATNILPSMYGFDKDAIDPDVFQDYLQGVIQAIQNSGNQNLQSALAQIEKLISGPTVNDQIKTWTQVIDGINSSITGTLQLPIVTDKFVTWVKNTYELADDAASYLGGIVIGGLAGLGIFNLIQGFQSWSQLTPDKRGQIVSDTVQLGTQLLSGLVQRTIRIESIFTADGLTTMQQLAIVRRIVVTGDSPELIEGLANIGNTSARWLADTQGTAGKTIADLYPEDEILQMLCTSSEEDVGLATKMFGNNLDEFLSTRLGPLLVLAAIGFSIYNIIQYKEVGDALAADILGIVGGTMTVFAAIGSWDVVAVAGGRILAGLVSVAGPLAIVAALAGVGLMLYELFKAPPEDPIKQFVDTYVSPAGFAVAAKASSIDYASPYVNPDQNKLMMIGFTLSANGQTLHCNPDGSISLVTPATADPACVWLIQTDGQGMSRIITVAQTTAGQSPVGLYLSQMSDGSVSFQPKLSATQTGGQSSTGASTSQPTVVTQTWWSVPQGTANLTSNGNLVSLALTLQAVKTDSNGNYVPSQVSGWLAQSGSGVSINASTGTNFTLTMSGMAPNFMSMKNLSFFLNTTPSQAQSWGPSFGIVPSLPLQFTLGGDPLPDFLSFDPTTGAFAPNGKEATTASVSNCTLTATSNILGLSATAKFTVTVAPFTPTPPPSLMLQFA